MKLKAIVIEEAGGAISSCLRKILPALSTSFQVENAHSVEESIILMGKQEPDIVLVDLDIHGGEGIALLRKTLGFSFHVIAFSAFHLNAIRVLSLGIKDFISKADLEKQMGPAVNKAIRRMKGNNISEMYQEHFLESFNDRIDRIIFRNSNGLASFEIDSIEYVESEGQTCTVFLEGNRKITLACSIPQLMRRLEKDDFFRLSPGHIVNVRKIIEIQHQHRPLVRLGSGIEIPFCNTRMKRLVRRFANV